MSGRFNGQLDLVDQKALKLPITVIGAGGIGSWTVLALAKMGCSNIKVYDFDRVEDHNVASQFFKEGQLGLDKVEALQENVLEQTGIKIFPFVTDINEIDIDTELIIVAVDSMAVRAQIAEKYKGTNKYIIDGRMGGLQMEIYKIGALNYPMTIVPQQDVDPDPCTAKSISFNGMTIGALIANNVRQFIDDTIVNGLLVYLFEDNSLLRKYYDSDNNKQSNEPSGQSNGKGDNGTGKTTEKEEKEKETKAKTKK